ncbi:hypothetical protein ACLESD_09245 [Pyxidicoccus sp. 3LFB2]
MSLESAACEHLSTLPSCRVFAQEMARDCVQGRNVLVLTGAQLSHLALGKLLGDALWSEGGPPLFPVHLTEADAEVRPATILSRFTSVEEDLLHPGLSPLGLPNEVVDQVFLVSGVERLPLEAQEEWVRYFSLWAKYPRTRTHALVLPLPSRPDVISPTAGDTHLAMHHWWGRMSLLDVQLLCRLLEDAESDPLIATWREAILPHLAGADVALAAKLWDVVTEPEGIITKSLTEHGRQIGLNAVVLKGAIGRAARAQKGFGRPSAIPAALWEELWGMGAAQYTAEHGVELTAVALAVLGQKDDVRHRIWRGQAGLLLPRLDQVRIGVCRILTERHGAGWPIDFGKLCFTEEELSLVKKDPLATEFGPLRRIVIQDRAKAHTYVGLVSHARDMRNSLAHYQMVSLGDFRTLCANQARSGLL